jgi:hypothetical protein
MSMCSNINLNNLEEMLGIYRVEESIRELGVLGESFIENG